jgi:Domain of unknown function (DUF6456)
MSARSRRAIAQRGSKNRLLPAPISAIRGAVGSEADGRTSDRRHTADNLSRMLEAGTISPDMYEAGRSFQTDFALAALDPLRARSMVLPVGRGGARELTDRQWDARRRVHRALGALGGMASPAGSCVWHVVGLQRSVREWALGQRWGDRLVRPDQAQGVLVAALGVLAACFGDSDCQREA